MRQPAIVIVDYGVGNTFSVINAIAALGYRKIKISAAETEIFNADVLVLPGVGAFEACIQNLLNRNLDSVLNEAVIEKTKGSADGKKVSQIVSGKLT